MTSADGLEFAQSAAFSLSRGGKWGVEGRRERKRVQAVISGGKLGKNMFRIWSLPMKLAEVL